MANGNGTLDSNPLWTWIRPVFSILFGILGLVLLGFVGFIALFSGDWIQVGIVATVSLAFLGIAFGIRTLDKILSTGISLTSAPSSQIPPKANGGQSTSTMKTSWEDDVPAVEKSDFDTWDGKPIIPFDVVKFDTEIRRDTMGQYGEENPATLFYEALAKTEGVAASWKFNNLQALKDCREFILGLAGDAFTWKWGVSFDDAVLHLNDPRGCTTCGDKIAGCTYPDIDFKARQLGMDYYVALRYYREAKQKVADLE